MFKRCCFSSALLLLYYYSLKKVRIFEGIRVVEKDTDIEMEVIMINV